MVVWAIFLTGSALVRDDGHVRADLVLRLLTPGQQRWCEVLNCIVAAIFCAGLAWYGWQITWDAYDMGETSNSMLRFPLWIYFACLPVGAGLMTMRYIGRLVRYLIRFDPETMAIQTGRES